MEVDALIEQYVQQTMACSTRRGMLRAPAAAPIIDLGEVAIGPLLSCLDAEGPSMSVMTLLGAITGEDPAAGQAEPVVVDGEATGFRGVRVADAADRWLAWGRARGHLLA